MSPSEDYLRAAVAVTKTIVAEHRATEPPDYGPYDRELWVRCSVCGRTFDDDRDFLEHNAEADE